MAPCVADPEMAPCWSFREMAYRQIKACREDIFFLRVKRPVLCMLSFMCRPGFLYIFLRNEHDNVTGVLIDGGEVLYQILTPEDCRRWALWATCAALPSRTWADAAWPGGAFGFSAAGRCLALRQSRPVLTPTAPARYNIP